MKRFIRGLVFSFAFLSIVLPVRAVPIEQYPELDGVVDILAKEHGFNRASLQKLFGSVTRRSDVIAAMERPREARPWHEYRLPFVSEERIRLGARYWGQHKKALARAEETFGVPAEVIVAIIGVETQYGANRGQYSALDALVTLASGYPRRAEFFRKELIEFMLVARELKVDPRKVQGSYAGALGIPQFIPSSYRAYAIDFDNDKKRDLFESPADAIGSVANFLRRHGWEPGEPVIEEAEKKGTLQVWAEQLGLVPAMRVREWVGHGIYPRGAAASTAVENDRAAALVRLEGESGPLYYLGYNNFYVITRYNHSKNYAMAVYELAQAIRARRQGET